MNHSLRTLSQAFILALAGVVASLPAVAQTEVPNPTPNAARTPAPMPAPGSVAPGTPARPPMLLPGSPLGPGYSPGGPSPMSPQTGGLPKYLEGIITLEEYQSLAKFQQQVNDDPTSKELTAKIVELRKQMQQTQSELNKFRAKTLADNPEIKAISDKMQNAMRAHSPHPPAGSMGPMVPSPATPTAPTQAVPVAKP